MKLSLIAIAVVLAASQLPASLAPADAKLPPLRDPVFLNIGFVCKWQTECMDRQQRAMKSALKYVRVWKPPSWKIEHCNRQASRRGRVDWIGFGHCIRNQKITRSHASSQRHR